MLTDSIPSSPTGMNIPLNLPSALLAGSGGVRARTLRERFLVAGPALTPSPHPMRPTTRSHWVFLLTLSLLLALGSQHAVADSDLLRVVVTSTDLASLAREIGGERAIVFSLSQGLEDPHTINVKPGFVIGLEAADLFIQVGLGIENAWLKDLLAGVKNPKVKPGGAANLNLGRGVRQLDGAEGTGTVGSFHEEGNPHYLLDPIEGLKAAKTISQRFGELRPEWKAEFERRHAAFEKKLRIALAGEECARDADFEAVVLQFERAKSRAELDKLLKEHQLGGWLAALLPYRGRVIVGDHDLWPYFARRYGLEVLGYLEPSPGVPPTTKHLQALISQMKERKVGVILSAPYFDARHARFVSEKAGAKVIPMAHQAGGRPGPDDYHSMLRHNVEQLLLGLKEAR